MPSAPIKQGYEFKGWYFDKDVWQNKLTEDYYENIALTGDVRVYAYYVKENVEPTKYLVTFETNGGTIIQPITTSLIEASPKTTKQNANFVGWYLDASFTQPVTFPFEVTRQVKLYAKWEEDQQSIIYTVDSSNYITGIESALTGDLILDIPSTINGKTIVGIDYGAFSNNKQIVEVIMPDTITYVYGNAFRFCSNLKKVTLSKSLTFIRLCLNIAHH